jgi:phosphoglycerol transferase
MKPSSKVSNTGRVFRQDSGGWDPAPSRVSTTTRSVAVYAGAALVCLALTFYLLRLWRADLRVPFRYDGGDVLPICLWIKGLKDNAWIFYNSRVGMPFGLDMYNYPLPEAWHLLIFKLLDLTTRHFGKVLNLFYLATFPAILLCSLYAFRRLGLSYGAALLTSFLYTFLPYHFKRGEGHLFLAAYYAVPLILLVTFRIFSDPPPFFRSDARSSNWFRGRLRFDWSTILICAILGSTGTGYYGFFACFLLVVAGATAAIRSWRLAPALSALAVITLICLTVALNIAPNILYGRAETASRSPGEAELYGLKITQLLLPVNGHPLPAFAKARARYDNAAVTNENETATLGSIGAAGFLFLLGWTAYRLMRASPTWLDSKAQARLDQAALLNLTAVFVGTIGGFGSLFALLIQPQFRCYNRISVYIAFLALFAVGLLLDGAFLRRFKTTSLWAKVGSGSAVFLLLVVGILDQTAAAVEPNYASSKAAFEQDERFVHSVEAVVPANSMIFQLPAMQFPETPGLNKMTTYDLVRGYLHSETLRWSYPAMKGEAADVWQQMVATMPPADMLRVLVCAGFSGLYIDRFGYVDNGNEMEVKVSRLLGEGPVVANSRLLFFSFERYRAALRNGMSDTEWREYQDRSMPPFVVYDNGVYPEEVLGGQRSRWCREQAKLRIYNVSSRPQKVVFEMSAACGAMGYHLFEISSPVLHKSLHIDDHGFHLRETFVLPAGVTQMTFNCEAPSVKAPGDPRHTVFRLGDVVVREDSARKD